jgi:site-specific DNA-cytosine methylase
VDLITAGYPCQPESTAGKRLGHEDERWLWADIWRVICDVAPRYVFVENVAAHLSGTWGRVLGDLAAGGWSVEWDCVPAAAVGAPHLRDRLFALAARCVAVQPSADAYTRSRSRQQQITERRGGEASWIGYASELGAAANAMPERRQTIEQRGVLHRKRPSRGAHVDGLHGWSDKGSASERTNADRLRGWSGWSSPATAPEPCLRGVDARSSRGVDRLSDRARLALLGNAVVPQAAAAAFSLLWERMHR